MWKDDMRRALLYEYNTDIIFYISHMYTIVIYDTNVKYRYLFL